VEILPLEGDSSTRSAVHAAMSYAAIWAMAEAEAVAKQLIADQGKRLAELARPSPKRVNEGEMRLRKSWARAPKSRTTGSSGCARREGGLVKARQEAGCSESLGIKKMGVASKLLPKLLRNPKTHPELLADEAPHAKTAQKQPDPAQGDNVTAKAQKPGKRLRDPRKRAFLGRSRSWRNPKTAVPRFFGAGSGCFCTTVSGAGFGSGATTGAAGGTTTGATEASSGLDTNNSG
jgi:hypothetical protein